MTNSISINSDITLYFVISNKHGDKKKCGKDMWQAYNVRHKYVVIKIVCKVSLCTIIFRNVLIMIYNLNGSVKNFVKK